MKNLSRSIRRHHVARLKKVRKYYWGHSKENPMTNRELGKVVQQPKPCTCGLCANLRRRTKDITIQEKRHLDMAKIVED